MATKGHKRRKEVVPQRVARHSNVESSTRCGARVLDIGMSSYCPAPAAPDPRRHPLSPISHSPSPAAA